MPATEIAIDARDPDVKSSTVRYWGPDGLFIEQVENGTGLKHTMVFSREAIPDVLNALTQFLHDPCK